jgi:hypothetical protein
VGYVIERDTKGKLLIIKSDTEGGVGYRGRTVGGGV